MDFRILGPLEVWNGERVLPLGGPKRRAALALLIVNANEVVGSDRLVDELWGEDAPRNATAALHNHISRLRKELGPELVATHGWGYALRTDPEAIDLHRFERLAAEAQRLPPADRAARLAEALSLWRGPPLADLTFERAVSNDLARLEERRLVVLEQRIDADLAAGRDRELVGELETLISENPLREHFRWQLILALYRGGRQAEALEAYREARRFLAEELGLEPSLKLRELERAILSQDPALDLPAPGDAPKRPEPGKDLPPELDPATPLLGRAQEIGLLRWAWRRAQESPGGAVFLRGPPGIGKTRLAAELAREVHAEGGSVIYAACAGPAEDALAQFQRAAQSGSRTLLVADDLHRAGTELAESVTALVPMLAERRLLLLGTYQEEESSPLLDALLAGADPSGDMRHDVPPLDAAEVRSIAALYTGPGFAEVPLGELVEATGGIPALVHRAARDWAREQASGRLSELASQTASEREELRAAERALEESVADFERVQARSDVFADAGKESVVCPFKGLATFRAVDAEYFFGREQLNAEIVARLVGAPFLGVIGQSGSGKSSAVRAGVLPAVAQGVIPGSERWRQVVIRPGESPMRTLEAALEGKGRGDEVFLVVDQFEEVFTVCREEAERSRFVEAVTALDGERVVIVVLRADYYGRCAAYPKLAELLAANQVLVGPMHGPELRRAIELPARRAGLRVEPELVDALVDDVIGEPGGLPLLSTALLELWQGRRGRTLTMEGYREKGGVLGAVTRRAEEVYQRLSPEQQALARSILCRLAAPGAGTDVVRRRVSLAELDAERNADAAQVLGALIRARLLTTSGEGVEVAHEALLREWPRLRSWLEDDAEGRRLHAHLMTAAREWEERGKDSADLYRGTRLASALDWSSGHEVELNERERTFLEESRTASERAEQLQRRENRRLRALLAGVVVLLAGASTAGGIAFSLRSEAKNEARAAGVRALANAAESNLQADPERSILLALEAVRRTRNAGGSVRAEAEQALLDAVGASRVLLRVNGAGGSVSFSPDGRRFASEGSDGEARVWGATTGKRLVTLGRDAVDVDYGSEGKVIAVAGLDGNATVWDAASGRKVRTLPGARGEQLVAAELGRKDSVLATLSESGALILWDLSTGRKLFERQAWSGQPAVSPVAEAVAFSADGRRLAAAGAGPGSPEATVWDVDSGAVVLALPFAGLSPHDVDLSPDGSHLALALPDGTVELRDAGTGRLRAAAVGHQGDVWGVEFSADGRRLATAGNDGLGKVWQVGSARIRQLEVLSGHTAPVEELSFSPDGTRLVTGSDDDTARVWDISFEGPRGMTELPAATPAFSGGIAFTADGRHLVVPSRAGDGVRVWDARSGRALLRLKTHGGHVQGISVSGDGTKIATTAADSTVEVWDARSGRRLFGIPIDRDCPAGVTPCATAVFSPDGSRLAVGSADSTARILDVATGEERRALIGHQGSIVNVAYSPDGRRLATASTDGTANVWDVKRKRRILTLDPASQEIADVGFTPNGRWLVTVGWDGRVRVWDASNGRQIRSWPARQGDLFELAIAPDGLLATTGDAGGITLWKSVRGDELLSIPSPGKTAVAFSPDGKSLASSAGFGQTVTVWPLDIGELVRLARSRVTRSLTEDECRRYLDAARCPH